MRRKKYLKDDGESWWDDPIYQNPKLRRKMAVVPKTSCRGLDGALRLEDASGNFVKSWSVSDFTEPYSVQETWLCESGKTYIVSFQGYAYSNNGGMYDDLVASKTFTCP